MSIQKLKNKLEELFGIDVRALALMRIAFSFILITDLIKRSFSLTAHYTDDGVLPRLYAMHLISPHSLCAYLMGGSKEFVILLFILSGLFAFFVLIGYRTTLSTATTWFLLQSLHLRNIMIDSGADDLFHILFFWAIFLPWGCLWSVDSRLGKFNAVPKRVSSMGTCAFLLQVAFFYTFAGINKMDNEWVQNGTAIYYVLHMDELVKPLGHYLLQFPSFLKPLSYTIYWVELTGPTLLFFPLLTSYLRLVVIFVFCLLHIGILLALETGPFQFISMAALTAFLPTQFLDKILNKVDSEKLEYSSIKHPLFNMPFYLSIVIGCLITLVLFINLSSLKKSSIRIPQSLQFIEYNLSLYQHWVMFSPVSKETGWYIIPGRLRNGKIVDIFKEGTEFSWARPSSILSSYGDTNSFWGKYYFNLHHKEFSSYRLPYGQYLCKQWNSQHPYNQQLLAFEIIYMNEYTLLNNQRSSPKKYILWSHYCFDSGGSIPVFKKDDFPLRVDYE
jgi:hypothetical protein